MATTENSLSAIKMFDRSERSYDFEALLPGSTGVIKWLAKEISSPIPESSGGDKGSTCIKVIKSNF